MSLFFTIFFLICHSFPFILLFFKKFVIVLQETFPPHLYCYHYVNIRAIVGDQKMPCTPDVKQDKDDQQMAQFTVGVYRGLLVLFSFLSPFRLLRFWLKDM